MRLFASVRPVLIWFALLGASSPAAAQSFVNFESPQTRPIALAPGGGLLYVVNTPDSRLSVIDSSTLALVAEIPVGLEPVAVAPRPGASEVWVVNHLSDSVDVIQVGTWQLLKTIPVGDEPASILFTPGGSKAYVTLSRPDQVAVIDAASRSVTKTLSLASPPSFNTQDPRAMALDTTGSFLYVLPFESGNRTRGSPMIPPDPSNKGTIVFDPALSDDDLFVIRTLDDVIVNRVQNLGAILTNIRVSPDNSRIYVTGWAARNLVFMIENLAGHATINQLAILDRNTLGVISRVDLDGPQPYGRSRAVAQPFDLEFDNLGRIWVAAHGNDEVVILNANGNRMGRIPVGRGPRGLAFDPSSGRLYVACRLSHEVTVIDTTSDAVVASVAVGYDPTPPGLSEGREILFSAGFSGDGTQACGACHVDGHDDNLVWDVGSLADPKGPMFTQSLRGLDVNAPYHWRGEKPDLLSFDVGFRDLLGGNVLPAAANERLAAYMGSIHYPPNPSLNRDGSLKHPLAPCGEQLFMGVAPVDCPPPGPGENRQFFPCVTCHALPHGSNHAIIPAQILRTHDDMEVPQLRGLSEKVGFLHDGRDSTLVEFLSFSPPFPPFPQIDKQAMAAFLLEFPTAEHHAAVGIERTANDTLCPGGILDPEIAGTISFLESEAALGLVDLTVAGTLAPHGGVHLAFDPNAGLYDFDRTGPVPVASSALTSAACSGTANLTWTAWPTGTSVRALDRDEDLLLNGDEPGFGTDPADPDTDGDGLLDGEEPPLGTNPVVADTDGDGAIDGEEVFDGTNPLDAASFLHFLRVDLFPGSDIEMEWTTVCGRSYEVESFDGSTFLTGDEVFAPIFTSPSPEAECPEGTEVFADPDQALPPGSCRFYRVKALPSGP